jgi:hypothetical protein
MTETKEPYKAQFINSGKEFFSMKQTAKDIVSPQKIPLKVF